MVELSPCARASRAAAGTLVEFGCWCVGHLGRLFDEAVEQEPPSAGGPAVEPEGELVEVVRQLGLRDGALVGTQQPPLDQGGHTVDARQEDMGRIRRGGLVDDDVIVSKGRKPTVSAPAIGEEAGAGLHGLPDEGSEGLSADVGNGLHSNAAQALLVDDLDCDRHDRLLLGGTPPGPFLDASHVGLVDLDDPVQAVPVRPHHRAPELVQPRPRGLVAEAEISLEPHGVCSVLLTRDLPSRQEPCPQRRARPVKDRTGQDRRLPLALRAHQQVAGRAPRTPLPVTLWADEPGGPPDPLQVGQATSFVGEEVVELEPVAWVVHASLKLRSRNPHDHNM